MPLINSYLIMPFGYLGTALDFAAKLIESSEMKLDNCEVCLGKSGGVCGNENRVCEIIMCDLCTELFGLFMNPAGYAKQLMDLKRSDIWLHKELVAICQLSLQQDLSPVMTLTQALRTYQQAVHYAKDGYRIRYVNDAGEQHPDTIPQGLPIVE
jgi:hypothetical protein